MSLLELHVRGVHCEDGDGMERVREAPGGELPEETALEAFAVDVYLEVIDAGDLKRLGERGVGLEEGGDFEVRGAFLALVCVFGAKGF